MGIYHLMEVLSGMEMTQIIDTGFTDWTHLVVILCHNQQAQVVFLTSTTKCQSKAPPTNRLT